MRQLNYPTYRSHHPHSQSHPSEARNNLCLVPRCSHHNRDGNPKELFSFNTYVRQGRDLGAMAGRQEAVAYLEIFDWVMEGVVEGAKYDFDWEDGDDLYSRKPLNMCRLGCG